MRPIQEKVLALEEEYSRLTDAELQAKTPEFKARLQNGETLDDLMGAICMIVPGMKYTREDNKIYIK